MNASENKRILQGVFAELAKGNGKPFADRMAEDFSWIYGEWIATGVRPKAKPQVRGAAPGRGRKPKFR